MFQKPSTLEASLTAIAVSIISSATIFGNSLVLYTFATDYRIRRVQYRFVASLAIADLLVGFVIAPLALVYKLLAYWPFGEAACEAWLTADVMLCTASMQHICVIGIDRHLSLTRPLTYAWEHRSRATNGLIAFVWILSAIIAAPPLLGWQPTSGINCDLSTDTGYIVYSACGSFYLPLIVTIVVYTRIWQVARDRQVKSRRKLLSTRQRHYGTNSQLCLYKKTHRKNRCKIKKQSMLTTSASMEYNSRCSKNQEARFGEIKKMYYRIFSRLHQQTPVESSDKRYSNSSCSSAITELRKISPSDVQNQFVPEPDHAADVFEQKSKAARRREMRSVLLLFAILVAFLFCWMPFFVIYVLRAVGVTVNDLAFNVFFFLGYANSAINPVLYAIINPEFRSAFKKAIRWKR